MSSRDTNPSRQSTTEGTDIPLSNRQPFPLGSGRQPQPSVSSSTTGTGTSTTTGPQNDEGGAPWDTPTAWGGGILHEKVRFFLIDG